MSPHTETPHVLVLSTALHLLRATLLTTDLHVVGGHSVAWPEREVEVEMTPDTERGDSPADPADPADPAASQTRVSESSTQPLSLHAVLGAFDSLLPVLAEYDLSTIRLVTSHVHILSPTHHSSPDDTSRTVVPPAVPVLPGTLIEDRVEANTPSHTSYPPSPPETSHEPLVWIPHGLLDRLESLHSRDRLSDILRSARFGGLTATPPRISRPSRVRRAAVHQHSERTDPSDEDLEYGSSIAVDQPFFPPGEKRNDTGQSPGYHTPEDRREDRKVTLRWLLYALLTRGGGVVQPQYSQYSTNKAPLGNGDSPADYGVETKGTVGGWWAKWGLRGAAVASPIPTALLLPTSTAPDDIHIHIHLGRTDTLSIRFPAPTAIQLESITHLGGAILPFQRNGVHAHPSSLVDDNAPSRGPAQAQGISTRPERGPGDGEEEMNGESGVCAVWTDTMSPAFRKEVRDKYGNGKWSQFGLLADIIPAGGSMGLDDKLFLFPTPSGPPVRFESGLPVAEFRELRANARCAFETQFMHWRALLRELDVDVRRIILTGSAGASPAVVSILSHIFRSAIYAPAYPHPFDVLSASLALARAPLHTATPHSPPRLRRLSGDITRPISLGWAETETETESQTKTTSLNDSPSEKHPTRGDEDHADSNSSTPRQIITRAYVPLTPPPSATHTHTHAMRSSVLNTSSPSSPLFLSGGVKPASLSEEYGPGGMAPDTIAISHADADADADADAFSDTDPTPRVRIVELPPTPPSEPADLPPTPPAKSSKRVTWTSLLPASTTILEESKFAIIDGAIIRSSKGGTSSTSDTSSGQGSNRERAGAGVAMAIPRKEVIPGSLGGLGRLVCLRLRSRGDGNGDGSPWEEKVYEAMQVEYERLRNLVDRGFVVPITDRAPPGPPDAPGAPLAGRRSER